LTTDPEMPTEPDAGAEPDILHSGEAGGRIIRGSAWRLIGNVAGLALGIGTAALLLRHLGVAESGRYVTVMSLVSIAATIADLGVTTTAGRELALRPASQRRELIANILGLRLLLMPPAILLAVIFALIAGYPSRMVIGTAIAGVGSLLVSVAHSFMARMAVELRNAGWAVIDFARQAVTLALVALLVALGAHLLPFFGVLVVTGLVLIALIPAVERKPYVMPRFDRAEQLRLLRVSVPMAVALVLNELYFRLVIVLMSLVSSPRQTGYYGGSLRAMDSLIELPGLLVGVAMPLLATAGRDDHGRLRYAVRGLNQVAVIAGVGIVLGTARIAVPVMQVIGGHAFGPAGGVLRIQVGALLFIALCQIWGSTLFALGRQRDLILTIALALAAVAVYAGVLVPEFNAQGGAIAGVCGDATLAALIYWRLRRHVGDVFVSPGFVLRVAIAAAVAVVPLLFSGLPDLVAAVLSGVAFIGVGELIGMVPPEVHDALNPRRVRRAAGP
jgi:O-antigen/teichoic acid export membrane protein